MHNAILIQHKNIPKTIVDFFNSDNIIEFDYSKTKHKNLDAYISDEIIDKLKDKNVDIIFIKDNLSSNYLELYGLRVAYHIRLTKELKDIRFIPIIFLSDIDGFTLNKIEPISKILLTKNIFLAPNTIQTIQKYHSLTLSNLSQSEYQFNFLDLISVEPPENSTNHSIANKWAMYKWAKALKLSDSDKINHLIKELSTQLYFKYIKEKNSILDDGKISSMPKKLATKKMKIQRKEVEKKKVLYIDDEHHKGWDDIFKAFFSKKRGYEFESLDITEKDNNFSHIEKSIFAMIEDIKKRPDLIILDMRLVDNDHKKDTHPKDISGIRILNAIKDISNTTKSNPGVQVIMLTASGRSDILDEALKNNKIVGYIKKEHPEDITINTKENIEKLKQFIELSEENFYLKEVWDIQYSSILNLDIFSDKKFNQIKVEVSFIFNILNSGIENKLKICMLTIYKVLEIIRDLYIDDKTNTFLDNNTEIKAIYSKDDRYVAYLKNDFINGRNQGYHYLESKNAQKYYYSTNNKICAIAYEKLSIRDTHIYANIKTINEKRNNYIHPPKQNMEIDVSKNEIIEWLKMLEVILSNIK
jgi:CheY-like chemotaxis protein